MSEPESHTAQARAALRRGDPQAGARFETAAYDALHALAQRQLRGERRQHTLQPTALVHEAWLKLGGQDCAGAERPQLLARAAAAMRRVLIDHARRQRADKRGGQAARVTLHADLAAAPEQAVDLLDLHAALQRLAVLDPRQAQIVELRYFAGLTAEEVADVLGVSRGTVQGDWHMARAWLRRELSQAPP